MLVPLAGVGSAPATGDSANGVAAGEESTAKAVIAVSPGLDRGDEAPAPQLVATAPQANQVKKLTAIRLCTSLQTLCSRGQLPEYLA